MKPAGAFRAFEIRLRISEGAVEALTNRLRPLG